MPSETPSPAYGQVWTYKMSIAVLTVLLVCPNGSPGAWDVVRLDGLLRGTVLAYATAGDPFTVYGLHADKIINGYTYIEG